MDYYNNCILLVQHFKKLKYNCGWFEDLVLQYTSDIQNIKMDEFYTAVAKSINKGPPIVMYGYERPSGADSSILVISNMWNVHSEDSIKSIIYHGVMNEVGKYMYEETNPSPKKELTSHQMEIIEDILESRRREQEYGLEMALQQHEDNMTPDVGYGRGVQKRNGRFYHNCQMK